MTRRTHSKIKGLFDQYLSIDHLQQTITHPPLYIEPIKKELYKWSSLQQLKVCILDELIKQL